jgi:hypothetical protein
MNGTESKGKRSENTEEAQYLKIRLQIEADALANAFRRHPRIGFAPNPVSQTVNGKPITISDSSFSPSQRELPFDFGYAWLADGVEFRVYTAKKIQPGGKMGSYDANGLEIQDETGTYLVPYSQAKFDPGSGSMTEPKTTTVGRVFQFQGIDQGQRRLVSLSLKAGLQIVRNAQRALQMAA